jgi:hypothetical protein
MNLREELIEAEARTERLRRQISAAGCATAGHDWKHIGGRNAGCDDRDCSCSVPVHECAVCGDCDYGDNPEADQTVRRCLQENRP